MTSTSHLPNMKVSPSQMGCAFASVLVFGRMEVKIVELPVGRYMVGICVGIDHPDRPVCERLAEAAQIAAADAGIDEQRHMVAHQQIAAGKVVNNSIKIVFYGDRLVKAFHHVSSSCWGSSGANSMRY